MAPAIPAGAVKGAAGGAAKGGAGAVKGGAAKPSGGAASGGSPQSGAQGGQQGGAPDLASMNPMNTDAGARIDQHKENLKALKEALSQKKNELKQAENQLAQLRQQQKEEADLGQPPTQGAAISQAEGQINNAKSDIQGLSEKIRIEEGVISALEKDIWTERKLNVASFIPEVGIAATVAQQMIQKKHEKTESKAAEKSQKVEEKTAKKKASSSGGSGGMVTDSYWGWDKVNSVSTFFVWLVLFPFKVVLAPLLLPLRWIKDPSSFSKDFSSTLEGTIKIAVGGAFIAFFVVFLFPRFAPAAINYATSGQLEATGEDAAHATKSGLSNFIKSFQTQMAKSTQQAQGTYTEGNTDKTVKEFVGIKIEPPLLPNPKDVEIGDSIEIGAMLRGYNPKAEAMDVDVRCYDNARGDLTDLKVGLIHDFTGQDSEEIVPDHIDGEQDFTQEVTCYALDPLIEETRIITIEAEAVNFETSAWLTNNFIDKTSLTQQLESYARSNGPISTESARNSALTSSDMFGDLADYKSTSDKGPAKVVMSTLEMPVIGVDAASNLKLTVAMENIGDGVINSLGGVAIQIPPGLGLYGNPKKLCSNWTYKQGFISLTPGILKRMQTELRSTRKGSQLRLPSCQLTVEDADLLLKRPDKPNPATFTALAIYDYVIQKQYTVRVKEPKGYSTQAAAGTVADNEEPEGDV